MLRFHFCSLEKHFSLCFMINTDFYYNQRLTSKVRKRKTGTAPQPGIQPIGSTEPKSSEVSTL